MLRTPKAIPHLVKALNDTSYRVRRSAVNSLEQIGGTGVLQALEHALSDDDKLVSHAAETAIKRLQNT